MTAYEILKGYYRIAEKDFWHEYNRKESRDVGYLQNTEGYMEGLLAGFEAVAITEQQRSEVEVIRKTLSTLCELY